MHELFSNLEVTIDGADVPVRGLAYDSRRVEPGFLFAALRGVTTDGHAFVDAALERGASCVLCEEALDTGAATRIVADDARRALALAARNYYGDPASRMRMIGVTGTNGKTTTTCLLEGILRQAGLKPGMIGTLGARYQNETIETSLTTPQSIDLAAMLARMHDAGCGAVAMEVSSHALVQHRVSGLAFDVAVFTNLTHDHLDYHGTLDAYFEAKAMLPRMLLKDSGTAVLNLDDPMIERLMTDSCIGFSVRGDARARVALKASTMRVDATLLQIETPAGVCDVETSLIGRFNTENVLAAFSAGVALGLDSEVIAKGIASVHAVPGRLERVSGVGEPLVVVDYAHTPDALTKALEAVGEITEGRLLCVFGCGGDRDRQKRAPMGAAAARGASWCVLTSDNPRSEEPMAIADDVIVGLISGGASVGDGDRPGTYTVELDRAKAIALAVRAARPEDAVLIAGKGHEDYQIIGGERRDFDDRQCAREALEAIRGAH